MVGMYYLSFYKNNMLIYYVHCFYWYYFENMFLLTNYLNRTCQPQNPLGFAACLLLQIRKKKKSQCISFSLALLYNISRMTHMSCIDDELRVFEISKLLEITLVLLLRNLIFFILPNIA